MDLKKSLILILIVLLAGTANAQPPVVNLPQVIPPPADAAALGRYGDIPVNMNTGNANISVPLYEIKTPRLTLPISLNYNSMGIKVDDIASWVGLEWSLNAGGVITRSVRGKDDFGPLGWYYSSIPLADTMTASGSWNYIAHVLQHTQDNEPDYFFYNFSGSSGKFFFSDAKTPVIINYQQPEKVQFDPISKNFLILDDKGNSYYFGAQENTTSGDYHGSTFNTYISSWYLSKIVSFDRSDSITFTYFTDNLLEQDYDVYTQSIGPYYTTTAINPTNNNTELTYFQSGEDATGQITGEPFTQSYPLRLKEIDFKNGKLSFFSSATRQDVDGVKLDSILIYNYNISTQQFNKLRSIDLKYDYYFTNKSNPPDPTPSPYRLRLDSVSFYGNDYSFGGNYRFLYDSSMLPWLRSNGKDQFDYYNGQDGNVSLIPTQEVFFNGFQYTVGDANRDVATNFLGAGILNTLYYPTGGYTKFTYESNNYSSQSTQEQVVADGRSAHATGGIKETDTLTFTAPNNMTNGGLANATANMTPYSGVSVRPFISFIDLSTGQVIYDNGVGDPTHGISQVFTVNLVAGQVYQLVADAYQNGHVSASIDVTWQDTTTTNTVQTLNGGGLRVKQLSDYDNSGRFLKSELYRYGVNESGYGYLAAPVNLFNTNSYVNVFSYSTLGVACSAQQANTTREMFLGSSIYDVFTLAGAPISYSQVSKYRVDSLGNNIGKSIFYYTTFQNSPFSSLSVWCDAFTILNTGWPGGQLYLQEDYVNSGGSFAPVKRTFTNYGNISLQQGRGQKIGWAVHLQGSPPLDSVSMASQNGCFPILYMYDYPIYTGTVLPQNQVIYDYDQSDTNRYVVSTKQFSYANLDHLQPTRINEDMSDGTDELVINRYPGDADSILNLTSDQSIALDSLSSRHNLTTLIQTQTYRNGTPVSLVRNDYKLWPANLILEDSVEWQNTSFPIESRLQFYNYDNHGNILQDAKASDVNYSFIWDYNSAYPIAQVTNAAQSDVAYTSFESDGTGNWTIGTGAVDTKSSITGANSFNLTGTISKTGLNSTAIYIVSYWAQGEALSVPGTISGYPVKGKTVSFNNQNWTLYVHKVTGQTTISVNGSGHIDELRLYPATAQMTTYTYTPLVGMTSQCDVGNRVTYYEYDGLARLKRIRDQDYNILKTYEYQYLVSGGCGNGCYVLGMQTLAGTNTLSYPVGVFDVHGKLVGNATGPAGYVSLWNGDTADARIGTLAPGSDSMHFTITLNAGQTAPAGVTGCRYYQYDLLWNSLDGVTSGNGAYVDFGDGIGMPIPATPIDTPAVMPPNTVAYGFFDPFDQTWWFIHSYPDSSLKTITFYHNDDAKASGLDNGHDPATSLTKISNFRGNIPQQCPAVGGSCFQQASALTVAGIANWNSITSIQGFWPHCGDGINPCLHMSYAQDFMKNNLGLNTINTTRGSYYAAGYRDTTFKLSRLKTDWNTYFVNLQGIEISDEHWNREDLTALIHLTVFGVFATNQQHSNNADGNPIVPIPTLVTDNAINQITAGSGQFNSNGVIAIYTGGTGRTSASDASVRFLMAKGWIIYIDGVPQVSP
jgi:hypothetical protein